MFQIWFQKSTSVLFQRSFFNNFSFFDWPFRICLSPLVYRFTSLIEMLFIFTKKRVFECSEADFLSVFILPDLMLLVVGFRKRAVHKECLVIGNEMYSPWAAPPLKKKRTKQYRLLVTSGCLLPRKVWWAVWIISFWPKNEVFYRPEWTNRWGPHENEFWAFSNSEVNITNRLEKVDEKNGVICLVYMIPSWFMVLKLSIKCIFCNFVLTSARNLSQLKQFTYMHLKSLVTNFQKLIFIMLWLTVSVVFVFEVEEFLRNFCWFSIFFWLRPL